MEDHAADELRYACLSRPYVPLRLAPPEEKSMSGYSSYGRKPRVSVNIL
jgi:hypothetical protein